MQRWRVGIVLCACTLACGGDDTNGVADTDGTEIGTASASTSSGTATTTTTSASTSASTTTSSSSGDTSTSDVDPTAVDTSGEPGDCIEATLLWSEDFESGDYARWTSMTCDAGWNGRSASSRASRST